MSPLRVDSNLQQIPGSGLSIDMYSTVYGKLDTFLPSSYILNPTWFRGRMTASQVSSGQGGERESNSGCCGLPD